MRCDEINEMLELYVLDGLGDDQRLAVEAHLRSCERCRASEAEYRQLVGQVRHEADAAVPTASFERGLSENLGREIAAVCGQHRRRLLIRVSASAAACILLALGVWQFAVPHGQQNPMSHAPAAQPAIPQVWQLVGAQAVATSSADAVVIHGSRMYILLNDGPMGRVAALDIASGNELWRSSVRSSGYLAAGDGLVYCLVSDSGRGMELVALDAGSGTVKWRCPPSGKALRAGPVRPLVLNEKRVCWSGDDVVSVIDTDSGHVVWSKPIVGEGLVSEAAPAGGHLYVATATALYCLDADKGSESWKMPLDKPASILARPLLAASGDGVFVATKDSAGTDRLMCVDPDGRRVAWDKSAPRITSLLAADGSLFVRGQTVRALDSATGDEQWAFKASGCGPVTHFDGRVYFVDSSKPGRLVALDAKVGEKKWEVAGLASCDAFNKIGDTGYLKTQDGVVHAIALASPRKNR